MELVSEYLVANEAPGVNLVLLHGWSSSREIWRPLVANMRGWANITLIDLPGCSEAQSDALVSDLATLSRAILDIAPPEAVYLGWSLGGQLASILAAAHPERVVGLVTICSNPSFVASQNWPGLDRDTFTGFQAAVSEDVPRGLRRFDQLQAKGAGNTRSLARTLASLRREPDQKQLLAGLELLQTLDNRAILLTLGIPQLHCFTAADALVPISVAQRLTDHLQRVPAGRVIVLPDGSHAAVLDEALELASSIREFCVVQATSARSEGAGSPVLSRSGNPSEQLLQGVSIAAKSAVADSFSRAAKQYDSAAQLQRDVGAHLLEEVDKISDYPAVVLDLGCGTGYFQPQLQRRFPQAHYLGLDLARGMVEYAREHFPQAQSWLVADAETLPLAAHSVDLIFSSLAVQWCHNPHQLYAELARVLKPGGRCVFTSLGPDTLKELRAAWATVDTHQHVNDFHPAQLLEQAAAATPGVSLSLRSELFIMQYSRVRELLDELKTLGAHNMNRGRQTGLTGRRALQGMLQAYESCRHNEKLPATYDVLFGVLEKT
ncbi:MAG: malonyl-ACP O-methyltransferase BioC [Halioglobus sp.]